jgi:hypothetical protein
MLRTPSVRLKGQHLAGLHHEPLDLAVFGIFQDGITAPWPVDGLVKLGRLMLKLNQLVDHLFYILRVILVSHENCSPVSMMSRLLTRRQSGASTWTKQLRRIISALPCMRLPDSQIHTVH